MHIWVSMWRGKVGRVVHPTDPHFTLVEPRLKPLAEAMIWYILHIYIYYPAHSLYSVLPSFSKFKIIFGYDMYQYMFLRIFPTLYQQFTVLNNVSIYYRLIVLSSLTQYHHHFIIIYCYSIQWSPNFLEYCSDSWFQYKNAISTSINLIIYLNLPFYVFFFFLQLEAGSALPKFGEWDKDPSAAEGYTDIFNKVKEEKQTGSSKSPMITDDSIYPRSSTHSTNYKSSVCNTNLFICM